MISIPYINVDINYPYQGNKMLGNRLSVVKHHVNIFSNPKFNRYSSSSIHIPSNPGYLCVANPECPFLCVTVPQVPHAGVQLHVAGRVLWRQAHMWGRLHSLPAGWPGPQCSGRLLGSWTVGTSARWGTANIWLKAGLQYLQRDISR